jgi:large subunit ribosomal protein L25
MERVTIKAEARDVGKKGVNRRLRDAGLIPAVLYGKGEQPRGLAVNAKEFTHLMKGSAGTNALIHLTLAGRSEKEPLVVMLKDYQVDSISRRITHIDLLKIDLKEKVTVKIPIHLTGKSIGVTKGGLVEQPLRELEVKCLPGNIPGAIEVDITPLDLGDSLHVNELKLPEGVELSHEVDFAVVSIVAPKEEEVAPPPAAAEAAPVAEGAPAAGAPAPAEAEAKGKEGEKK